MNLIASDSAQRDVRLTRLYYFLFFGGLGFMSPFLNLFFIHQGLDGTQIGLITSVGAAVTLLAAPFWANRNVHWRNPRAALQIFLVLTALSFLWFTQQTLFWGIAVVSVFRALVSAGISPLSDSLALTVTRTLKAGFGSVRVWGSFGWVVFVPLSGWLVDHSSLQTSLFGACLITTLAALILFPLPVQHFTAEKSTEPPPNFRAVLGKVISTRAMLGVAAMIVIVGIANSGVLQFESVYLRQLGANDIVIGIASMLSALVELPCMLWADRLVARRGPYPVLLIAVLLYGGVRLMVWGAPSIGTILLTRALTGFGYSFYTVSLVRFAAEQTTSHERRTVLALYTVTLTNLVTIIGSPLTGAIYDQVGARWLYLLAAAGYLAAWGGLRIARLPRLPNT